MVRISVSIGILIELWKVPKVVNFEVSYSYGNFYYSFNFSVYQIKHGWELFPNINMFLNNHIQIHQHQTMIEFVEIKYREKQNLIQTIFFFSWPSNISHGFYFH
jgi:hypothetical protein